MNKEQDLHYRICSPERGSGVGGYTGCRIERSEKSITTFANGYTFGIFTAFRVKEEWQGWDVGAISRRDFQARPALDRDLEPLLRFTCWFLGVLRRIFIHGNSANPGFISFL